jgi:hypothetical protein
MKTEKMPSTEYIVELQKWFSGSKVVDPTGNPLVLFHGTAMESFEHFRASDWHESGMFGKGINFTSDPGDASKYASPDLMVNHDLVSKAEVMAAALTGTNAGDRFSAAYREAKLTLTHGGGHIIPVILSIKNPLIISNLPQRFDERKFMLAAAETDISQEDAKNLFRRFGNAKSGSEQFEILKRSNATKIYRQMATLNNNDGLVILPELAPKSNGATHYLALDPDQVKFALQLGPLLANNLLNQRSNASLLANSAHQALDFLDSLPHREHKDQVRP